jgi:hypothetical protein
VRGSARVRVRIIEAMKLDEEGKERFFGIARPNLVINKKEKVYGVNWLRKRGGFFNIKFGSS